MKTVEDYEQIRRAFFVEGLSIRAIHRRLKVDRATIRKAIFEPTPKPYQLEKPRPAPVLGPYKQRIRELLDESDELPRKQRYTARTIYRIIRAEGYQGSEGGVHNYVSKQRKGSSIAANKVKGIRAALCGDAETARGARWWNDANVLVMSLRKTSTEVAKEILDAWFSEKVLEEEKIYVEQVSDIERRHSVK